MGVQRRQLRSQPRVTEVLLDELGEFGALLCAHRVEHPLRRRGPGGQRVDQLLDIAGPFGEEVPVLAHELLEALGSVRGAAGMGGEQIVEVGQHPADPLDVLGGAGLQRLLHALEALFEQLLAEQVADLLIGLGGFGRAPVVVGELGDGAGSVRG